MLLYIYKTSNLGKITKRECWEAFAVMSSTQVAT